MDALVLLAVIGPPVGIVVVLGLVLKLISKTGGGAAPSDTAAVQVTGAVSPKQLKKAAKLEKQAAKQRAKEEKKKKRSIDIAPDTDKVDAAKSSPMSAKLRQVLTGGQPKVSEVEQAERDRRDALAALVAGEQRRGMAAEGGTGSLVIAPPGAGAEHPAPKPTLAQEDSWTESVVPEASVTGDEEQPSSVAPQVVRDITPQGLPAEQSDVSVPAPRPVVDFVGPMKTRSVRPVSAPSSAASAGSTQGVLRQQQSAPQKGATVPAQDVVSQVIVQSQSVPQRWAVVGTVMPRVYPNWHVNPALVRVRHEATASESALVNQAGVITASAEAMSSVRSAASTSDYEAILGELRQLTHRIEEVLSTGQPAPAGPAMAESLVAAESDHGGQETDHSVPVAPRVPMVAFREPQVHRANAERWAQLSEVSEVSEAQEPEVFVPERLEEFATPAAFDSDFYDPLAFDPPLPTSQPFNATQNNAQETVFEANDDGASFGQREKYVDSERYAMPIQGAGDDYLGLDDAVSAARMAADRNQPDTRGVGFLNADVGAFYEAGKPEVIDLTGPLSLTTSASGIPFAPAPIVSLARDRVQQLSQRSSAAGVHSAEMLMNSVCRPTIVAPEVSRRGHFVPSINDIPQQSSDQPVSLSRKSAVRRVRAEEKAAFEGALARRKRLLFDGV